MIYIDNEFFHMYSMPLLWSYSVSVFRQSAFAHCVGATQTVRVVVVCDCFSLWPSRAGEETALSPDLTGLTWWVLGLFPFLAKTGAPINRAPLLQEDERP